LLQLQDNGLLTVDGHTVRMTPEGQPFVRLAAAAFDAYVAGGKGRHSSAV
jgi:oxygen-independent coproporphyrinogen-3 oxidase